MIRRPLVYVCCACIAGMAFQYFFQIPKAVIYGCGMLSFICVLVTAFFFIRFCTDNGLAYCEIDVHLFEHFLEHFLMPEVNAFLPHIRGAGKLKSKSELKCKMGSDFSYHYICKRLFVFLLVIAFCLGIAVFQHAWDDCGVLYKSEKKYIQGQGLVLEAEEKSEDEYRLVVKMWSNEMSHNDGEKVLVTIYDKLEDYYKLPGKKVSVSGLVELPSPRRNPKCFDYRLYLKTLKIHTMMSVSASDLKVLENGASDSYFESKSDWVHLTYYKYLNWISQVKYKFKENLSATLDEELVALLAGMVLGDSDLLEDSTYEKFQKNGICHILAVSGLHVGTLYACIAVILGKRRDVGTNIFIVLILFFYCSIAGFSPSVVRASVMIAVHLLGNVLLKRYDMLTGTMVTMLLMLLANPLMLLNLGFQLSYIAILTLAIVMPAVMRMLNSKALAAIVIQLGIAPISAYTFNYFSFVAILANVPALFLGGILIPLGILLLALSIVGMYVTQFELINGNFTCVLGVCGNQNVAEFVVSMLNGMIDFVGRSLAFIFEIISICCEFFGKLLIFCNDVAFVDGISYVHVVSPPLWSIFLYYGLLTFISSETFRILWQRRWLKNVCAIGMCIVMVAVVSFGALKDGFENSNLIFLDVGQGDCLFIRTDDGKTVMVDSGGSSNYDVGESVLLPFCLKNGIDHIDAAVITHFHMDHCKGLETLARLIPVEKLVLYEGNSVKASAVSEQMGISVDDFVYMAAGDTLQLGEDLIIEALAPERLAADQYESVMADSEDENASSLIAKVHIEGVTVMMTGDIDAEGETRLLEEFADTRTDAGGQWSDASGCATLGCDILKVAHHGSKYGTSQRFLDAVQPKVAVIQVGKNNYGHPNSDTIGRLASMRIPTYRNDLHGAIGIEIEDGAVEVRTMLGSER